MSNSLPGRRRDGCARAARRLAAVALAAAACVAAIGPARAGTPPLTVDFVANGTRFACPAADVAFQRTTTTQVSWRCAGAATRFRCNLTAAGVFATDVNVVALNCNRLTELPPSSPPTLLHASGFESA